MRLRLGRFFQGVKINKIIKGIAFSDFFIVSGFGLIAPIFAVFATDQIGSGDLGVAGFALACYAITKSILQIPIGRFLDMREGEADDYRVMIAGSAMAASVPFLYMLVGNPLQLYFVQVLYGIAGAMVYSSNSAIFTRHVDKNEVGLENSLYFTLTDFGSAIAAAFGGILAQTFGFYLVFIAAGCANIIGVLIIGFLRGEFRKS